MSDPLQLNPALSESALVNRTFTHLLRSPRTWLDRLNISFHVTGHLSLPSVCLSASGCVRSRASQLKTRFAESTSTGV